MTQANRPDVAHRFWMHGTRTRLGCAVTALTLLTACGDQPLDFDLRGLGGGFSTAQAAQNASAERPKPDARGVISYPNYQVVVARRGDTINSIASRIGTDAGALGRFNGIDLDTELRAGEIIALPTRVTEPAGGPIRPAPVDISTVAGQAIDRAEDTQVRETSRTQRQQQTGQEPVRHQVERGETAYSIARLYQVSVQDLAEWNGLGSDFAIREGQFLLIPVPRQAPPPRQVATATPPPPGSGSRTPLPPSSLKPLPDEEVSSVTEQRSETPKPPPVDLATNQSTRGGGAMVYPVQGRIIREYSKGRNDGIDIAAAAGTPVKAAAAGTVAAITADANQVPIIVVRHPDNLLTVYANVNNIRVAKGDQVSQGQNIAELRSGNDAYVHFEVRQGFESVDPKPYLQ